MIRISISSSEGQQHNYDLRLAQINRRVELGQEQVVAAKSSGWMRFRATIVTFLTSFMGLVPIIFESNLRTPFLAPMAITLGFGILFSTVALLC